MSETSDFIRKVFADGDTIRDAGLTTPEDVIRFDDIQYGSDPKWQVLDVYRPKDVRGELPVIVIPSNPSGVNKSVPFRLQTWFLKNTVCRYWASRA